MSPYIPTFVKGKIMCKKPVIILIAILLLPAAQVHAQKKCKVLVKEISLQYHGKCKKGLAQGKGKAQGIDTYTGHFRAGYPDGNGTYNWSNGNSYTGQWKKGKRQGTGVLKIHTNGGDSIVKGLWKEDRYLGPVPSKPEVLQSISIDRYSFVKTGDIRKRVLIDVFQNGSRNTELNDLITYSSSGTKTQVGNSFGYEFIDFPVTIKVNYYTLNKLHTVRVYVKFEFTISEPGDWRVTIIN